ncbi:23961_t:CDS:2 [Cetraspora pellucida]|uniref:23961_t:CDS:1 n=1 Tax=Cetraspora pellucida TaxID=1433469 RepID=A0A9N9A197_9GLOM|nr:23961_t:CDS:2 [Cetraspora pellucida]
MPHLSKTHKSNKNARHAKKLKSYKNNSNILEIKNSTCDFYIRRHKNLQLITLENTSTIDLLEIEQSIENLENLVNQTSTSQLAISKTEKIKSDLVTKFNYLSEKELIACSQLFNNMTYKDGPNKGKILSAYLQEKTAELLFASHEKSSYNFQEEISDKNIEKAIVKKIKQNNREYTPEFVSMATILSTISQISISSTVQCTKEIITFLTGQPSKSCLSPTDKSTRGEKKIFLVYIAYWNENKQEPMLTILNMKDLDHCLASTVSLSVGEAISKNLLNPAQCQYWLTDNTAYMSGSTAGAVIKFNQQYSAKAAWIPCGLYALHIASVHFNDVAFGKINSLTGICLKPHLSNVLNLAYYLHCRYNKLDKDNPLNMKTKKISKLYKALLNYNLKQYQKPISTHWLYQLTTAKQYLDRKDIQLQFSSWFINQLEQANKILESYLKK